MIETVNLNARDDVQNNVDLNDCVVVAQQGFWCLYVTLQYCFSQKFSSERYHSGSRAEIAMRICISKKDFEEPRGDVRYPNTQVEMPSTNLYSI